MLTENYQSKVVTILEEIVNQSDIILLKKTINEILIKIK